jgi:hypothetical protein
LVGDGAIDEAEGDAEKGGGGRRDRTNWVSFIFVKTNLNIIYVYHLTIIHLGKQSE